MLLMVLTDYLSILRIDIVTPHLKKLHASLILRNQIHRHNE